VECSEPWARESPARSEVAARFLLDWGFSSSVDEMAPRDAGRRESPRNGRPAQSLAGAAQRDPRGPPLMASGLPHTALTGSGREKVTLRAHQQVEGQGTWMVLIEPLPRADRRRSDDPAERASFFLALADLFKRELCGPARALRRPPARRRGAGPLLGGGGAVDRALRAPEPSFSTGRFSGRPYRVCMRSLRLCLYLGWVVSFFSVLPAGFSFFFFFFFVWHV